MTERQDLIRTALLTCPVPYMRAQQIAEVLNRMGRSETAPGIGAALAGLRHRNLVCKRIVFHGPLMQSFSYRHGRLVKGMFPQKKVFWFATERLDEVCPNGMAWATERKMRGVAYDAKRSI